jgi:hypothetical protein
MTELEQPHRFRFGGVVVHVARDLCHVRTEFPGGASLDAAPNHDEESVARAISLGYDGDTRLMSAEHEICHSILARALKHGSSPTLRYAAGGPEPGPLVREAEESIVLAIQALANGRPPHAWSEALRLFGASPQEIVRQLLRIRRTLKNDT